MKDGQTGPFWKGLNLGDAIRILEDAGKPNPFDQHSDPKEQFQALIDGLCDLSLHDGLTGLVNSTFFKAALASELDRSSRTGRTCGLLMIDLDNFKEVNDKHGHNVGDATLRHVARQMKYSLRSMDTAARIGGDEFAVILPECPPEDAARAAIRIHSRLNPINFETEGKIITLTTSAGLSWTSPRHLMEVEMFMALVDEQLYRAKRGGRQRLCHPTLLPTQVSMEEKSALVHTRIEEGVYGK